MEGLGVRPCWSEREKNLGDKMGFDGSPALRELTEGLEWSWAVAGHAGRSEWFPRNAAAIENLLGKFIRLCSGTKTKKASIKLSVKI